MLRHIRISGAPLGLHFFSAGRGLATDWPAEYDQPGRISAGLLPKCLQDMPRARIILVFVGLVSMAGALAAPPALVPSSADAGLPFSMPSFDEVLNSPKKVFAHYVPWHPLSLDNLPWTKDYYQTQYLSPEGEGGKFKGQGGMLRQRPLPVPPSTDPNWQVRNMETEIRMAIARGINGFAFDTISVKYVQSGGLLRMMLEAAQAVDSRFKILLVPDMSGVAISDVMTMVETVGKHPSLYRWSDGRLLVSPFWSQTKSPGEWSSLISQLDAEGIRIAFLPMFSNLGDPGVPSYAPISVGMANFGNPGEPRQLEWTINSAKIVRGTSAKCFFDGVVAQGYQQSGYSYFEAANSLAYRNAWEGAIKIKADMIQIVTWNDLGENTNVEPAMSASGDRGTGFYDLTGYYATWWRNGAAPPITRDALYYFYRKEPHDAAAPNMAKHTKEATDYPPQDKVEVLAFLTAPGTISITVVGKKRSKAAPAGLIAFTVPSAPGIPEFELTRNGGSVIKFQGRTRIYGAEGLPSGLLDLTYWSGSNELPMAPVSNSNPTHTANFGAILQEKLLGIGAECELVHPGAIDVKHACIEDYLIEKLNAPAR